MVERLFIRPLKEAFTSTINSLLEPPRFARSLREKGMIWPVVAVPIAVPLVLGLEVLALSGHIETALLAGGGVWLATGAVLTALKEYNS